MLHYIDGNLLDNNLGFEVIVHGCNCFCTMGSGLAPQIKALFPEAYEVDCKTNKGDKRKLGSYSRTYNTNPIVINAYTQYHYNGRLRGERDADYDAIRSVMRLIKRDFPGKRIGLPLIGAGLAGGDWDIISKIIEEELVGEYVTIVKFKK